MQYAVVMAGGAGTRLWPAARRAMPKQLQELIFERPLIAETVHRLAAKYGMHRVLIVTAQQYVEAIGALLPELPEENIIAEPVGRNTAAAIALAALHIAREDPQAVFAIFPADHVILKPEALFKALEYAFTLAETHRVVDIGVPPTHPETGYGYIELADEVGRDGEVRAFAVKRFVEKPDARQAQEYVNAGNYIWNSGMFVWRVDTFLQALREHLPDTHDRLRSAFGDPQLLTAAYGELEEISVDYAIMERTTDVVALPVDFGWRDVGDWAALYDLMEHDADGNAAEGQYVTLDTLGSLLLSPKKLVAAIGVENLVIVDTGDVLLVMPRDRAQDVKKILDKLKAHGKAEYL
ncbi:MAG: mannose-1-phosphate guanylyltransferase [Chloroflexota bacterium]